MVEEHVECGPWNPGITNCYNKQRPSQLSSLTFVMVGLEAPHPDQHYSENLSLHRLVVEELVGPAILT